MNLGELLYIRTKLHKDPSEGALQKYLYIIEIQTLIPLQPKGSVSANVSLNKYFSCDPHNDPPPLGPDLGVNRSSRGSTI